MNLSPVNLSTSVDVFFYCAATPSAKTSEIESNTQRHIISLLYMILYPKLYDRNLTKKLDVWIEKLHRAQIVRCEKMKLMTR